MQSPIKFTIPSFLMCISVIFHNTLMDSYYFHKKSLSRLAHLNLFCQSPCMAFPKYKWLIDFSALVSLFNTQLMQSAMLIRSSGRMANM